MDVLAYLGGILLALCSFPLALEALKTKDTSQLNLSFLSMWTAGEVFLLISYWGDGALMINYGVNLLCLGVVWCYWRRT